MKVFFHHSIALLSFFILALVVNAAPVDLQSRQARLPSVKKTSSKLTVCSKGIELRSSNYASKCKNIGSLKPGVVQVKGTFDYHFLNTDAQMRTALAQPFNKANNGQKTSSGKNPATLIQCDHALELQYIKFLFESSEKGAKAACQTMLEDSDAKDDFLNLINGDLNLFNLDSKLNNYKGKVVTTMVAAARVDKVFSKITLPVLKSQPIPQIYSGLGLYYKQVGNRQIEFAKELFTFLNGISGDAYDDEIQSHPAAQVEYLTKIFNAVTSKPSTNRIKRILPSATQWITFDPKHLVSYYKKYNSVGTVNNGEFQEYLQEFHPETPAEDEDDEDEDQSDALEVEDILSYGEMPTSLNNPNLLVLGDLETEDSSPACVRPRDSNDEAALSCTLGGGSSPSNHSGILPLSSNANSSLSESSLSEGSLDTSSIKVLPTSTLLGTEAAQSPLNTFNRVNTLEPVNTLNRAQTFDSRPTSPTMNAILPMNPQLKPTFASTSINRFPNVVKTPVYRQSLNNGLNQNQYHSTLPFSRIPQAIPTQVSTRKFPISSNKVFSTRRLLPTTPVGSLPFRPIKNSLAFGPTVALGSVRGPSRYKLS